MIPGVIGCRIRPSGPRGAGTRMLTGEVMCPRPCSTAVAEQKVGLWGPNLPLRPKIAAQRWRRVYKLMKPPVFLQNPTGDFSPSPGQPRTVRRCPGCQLLPAVNHSCLYNSIPLKNRGISFHPDTALHSSVEKALGLAGRSSGSCVCMCHSATRGLFLSTLAGPGYF